MSQDIIFYDTFLHKHTPTRVITHFLKHQRITSQHFNLQNKFLCGTERYGAPTADCCWTGGTYGATQGTCRFFYILPMHLLSHSCSLLTSLLFAMVVSGASAPLGKAQGVVQKHRVGMVGPRCSSRKEKYF